MTVAGGKITEKLSAPNGAEWWTASELIELGSKALPTTPQAINAKAKRHEWRKQIRAGQGGAWEYHLSALPEAARQHIARLALQATRPQLPAPVSVPAAAAAGNAVKNLAGLPVNSPARRRAEARLLVLAALEQYRQAGGLTLSKAIAGFIEIYHSNMISVPDLVREELPEISRSSLFDWMKKRDQQGAERLAGNYRGRKEDGAIDKNATLRELLIGMYAERPDLPASVYLNELQKHLPNVRLPSLRVLQRWLTAWKTNNPRVSLQIENPDKAKSKYLSAIGSASAGINRANQLWEMDATPADILLKDGRWCLTGAIDIATRRAAARVTRTPTQQAHMGLIRHSALRHGMPEAIRTDNGKDYIGHSFVAAVAALSIEHRVCTPFSPEKKPHIERFFGTLTRDLFARLPGFSGHSVAHAQAIRARRTFANRLGTADEVAFSVDLTAAELQANIDSWLDAYHNRPHSALGDRTPNELSAELGIGIRGIPEERRLDLLLMDLPNGGGQRIVQKNGIEAVGTTFIASWIGPHIGYTVLVRLDPTDMGTIHCFDPSDGAYIGAAIAEELFGIERQQIAAASKAAQRAIDRTAHREIADIKKRYSQQRLAAAIASGEQLPDSVVIQLPHMRRVAEMTTEQQAELDAATDEILAAPAPKQDADVAEADARFARWHQLDQAIKSGEAISEQERGWHRTYHLDPECQAYLAMIEDFGEEAVLRKAG
ncbi:DDE-type integrase/transposase/recombinase [Ferrovibrio terrae]|uniref:DDE-type integrase/transposase/recombinase n=1 Tax=Ferrovibrio terrae TaxID=2594003 RepID=UPI003137F100